MQLLGDGTNLLLIVIGFGLLVAVHELGHFLAARWAGIRVEAFAVGMGPTVVAFRRGIGVRLGSTASEMERRFGCPPEGVTMERLRRAGVGETEYGLRLLPLGGFVRMKGQEDLQAIEGSADADAYPSRPIWKRMVVVSAGVVMNAILAVALYIGAFLVGVKFESATVGEIRPGTPVALAKAIGGGEAGLRTGDRIERIDGAPMKTFADAQIAVAMSKPGQSVRIDVARAGVDGTLQFEATPTDDPSARLRSIGLLPAHDTELAPDDEVRALLKPAFERSGLEAAGVGPGWRLASVHGAPVRTAESLTTACESSGGKPVATQWTGPDGSTRDLALQPVPALQAIAPADQSDQLELSLLGLCPLTRIDLVRGGSLNDGVLRPGDVVLSIEGVRGPRLAQFRDAVRSRPSRSVALEVLREGGVVPLTARVDASGRLDVVIAPALDLPLLAQPIERVAVRDGKGTESQQTAVAMAEIAPLTRFASAGAAPVTDWRSLRDALQAASREGASEVRLELVPWGADAARTTPLPLSASNRAVLLDLGWSSPLPSDAFAGLMTTLTADGNPLRAAAMGFDETAKLAVMTWLTIDRLARGSVPVDQLRGPVGIVHVGTRVADRGFTYLVFFLAMISVNLAVLNFLPLPIVDGGLFLYLVYEALRGRPPSVRFQNAATMAGLLLIGGLFVVTFYNDVMRLVGR